MLEVFVGSIVGLASIVIAQWMFLSTSGLAEHVVCKLELRPQIARIVLAPSRLDPHVLFLFCLLPSMIWNAVPFTESGPKWLGLGFALVELQALLGLCVSWRVYYLSKKVKQGTQTDEYLWDLGKLR